MVKWSKILYNNSELKSLVHLYIFGKENKDSEKFNKYKNKDDYKNKRFVKNMYDGMQYFLDFLRDPVGYCSKYTLTLYYNNQNPDNIYRVVHKIDEKRFLIIVVNFVEYVTTYLMTYNNETLDIVKNERVMNQDVIKRIFSENNNFFENELVNINGLLKDRKILPNNIK
jgi:hypothetical protein